MQSKKQYRCVECDSGAVSYFKIPAGGRPGDRAIPVACPDCSRIDGIDPADARAWRREIAFEEGMLHGIDAYNDAMGWSVGPPDDDPDNY